MAASKVALNGNDLRFLRKASNTTLDEASRKARVDASTLSRWETGQYSPSNMAIALDLVAYYAERAERGVERIRKISEELNA